MPGQDKLTLGGELQLLVDVIRSDGRILDEEVAAFETIARRYGAEFGSQDEVRKHISGSETAVLPRHGELPRRERNAIVRHMIEVAMADGELHPSESALIRQATERLLLPAAD